MGWEMAVLGLGVRLAGTGLGVLDWVLDWVRGVGMLFDLFLQILV